MKNEKKEEIKNGLMPTTVFPDKGITYFPGNPRKYRFRAKEGKVVIEDSEGNIREEICNFKKGEKIDVRPVAVRTFSVYGLFPKYPKTDEKGNPQDEVWTELYFLNESGQMCIMLINRISTDALNSFVSNELFYDGGTLTKVNLSIGARSKVGKGGDYWHLTFGKSDKEISEFPEFIAGVYWDFSTHNPMTTEIYNEGWAIFGEQKEIETIESDLPY